MMDPIYNPLELSVLENPYPVFARLRQTQPIYWHEQMKSWVLTRYKDCREVLRDHETWARDRRRVGGEVAEEFINMQSIDPPDVIPLRAGFFSAFQSINSRAIAETANDIIKARLSLLQGSVSFCFMKDFALPVSELITCEVFGLNPTNSNVFHEIAYGIALQMDSGLVPEQRMEGRKVATKLREIVDQGFSLRKEGGLFNSVIKAFENTDWPHQLMQSSMDAMLNASYSTIYTVLGNTALAIARNPQILREITSENLALAADEFIRYDSPAQGTSRIATKETTIGDVLFKPKDVVITMFAAANHDPEFFANPEMLNVNRSPNPHLGFGFGTHACLGTKLARTVLQQFVANMITSPQLHIIAEPKRFRTATLRWLESFPVSFQSNKSN